MVVDREGKTTDLLCLVCNEAIKLPPYIPRDYKGELVCQNQKCKSLLHIKLVNSQVVEYRILEDRRKVSEVMEKLQKIAEQAMEE